MSMIFLKHGPQGKAGRLKGVFGMVKTNVMRLLDAARIVYETGTYEVDEKRPFRQPRRRPYGGGPRQDV